MNGNVDEKLLTVFGLKENLFPRKKFRLKWAKWAWVIDSGVLEMVCIVLSRPLSHLVFKARMLKHGTDCFFLNLFIYFYSYSRHSIKTHHILTRLNNLIFTKALFNSLILRDCHSFLSRLNAFLKTFHPFLRSINTT